MGRSSYHADEQADRKSVEEGTSVVSSVDVRGGGIDHGFNVPGFSFQIGSGGFDVRPGRPGGSRDRVCFYENTNFRGDSFCARPGERLARLGRWDDSIRSIEVRGSAEVQVCERTNFNGRCIVISRSVANLRGANDNISSLRVR